MSNSERIARPNAGGARAPHAAICSSCDVIDARATATGASLQNISRLLISL